MHIHMRLTVVDIGLEICKAYGPVGTALRHDSNLICLAFSFFWQLLKSVLHVALWQAFVNAPGSATSNKFVVA